MSQPNTADEIKDAAAPVHDRCYTALSYDWLSANGFHRIEKGERQPHDFMRRCIRMETLGEKFMVAEEDLCLDLCPSDDSEVQWHCWVTKAEHYNRHPTSWIHTRMLRYAEEVALMYEGLTGRRMGPRHWKRSELALPLFPSV
ncbi:MAG: hypothetical protein AAF958_01405 [Planctomycetota bacterium]